MQNKRIRAVSVVIDNNKVLLIHRRCKGKEYYVFPGGGVEKNESVQEAVLRELFEETTLIAEIDHLLYIHEYADGSEQYFYLLKNPSGTPKLHEKSIENRRNSEKDFYEPMWVDFNKLKQLKLYPLEIRDWFTEDIKNNFINCPKKQFIKLLERKD